MLNKVIRIAVILGTVFVLGIVLSAILWNKTNSALSDDVTKKSFVIAKGLSASKIGDKLEKEGLIKSSSLFKLYTRFIGKSNKIPPGSYLIPGNLKMTEVVDVLLGGPKDLWVLIPEGLRREQIAITVSDQLGKDGGDKETFVEEFLTESKGLEGYLFPDTYLFPAEVAAKNVVTKLNQTFYAKTTDLFNRSESGLSSTEVVVLASIIEREERKDSQRPLVAGILLNRIDIGMPLQADATVQYVLGSDRCGITHGSCEWWPTVLRGDLETDSPFNTYVINGLPQSPICSPGLASIRAVLEPQRTEALYYIHDDSGNIHTGKTFAEHNANISKYLR